MTTGRFVVVFGLDIPGVGINLAGMRSIFDDMFSVLEVADRPAPAPRSPRSTIPARVEEDQESYSVSMVVPGIPKEEIDVEVAGRRLRISHEAKAESGSRLAYKSFERSWNVPEDADLERVSADAVDGILTVRVPKLDSVVRPRKIAIGAPPP